MFLPSDYAWSHPSSNSGSGDGSLMDLDVDPHTRPLPDTFSSGPTPSTSTKRLEFTGIDADERELEGLGDLDISFDTDTLDDGKIRVRIHPSSSASASRTNSRGVTPEGEDRESRMSVSSSTSSPRISIKGLGLRGASPPLSALTTASSDPFLGITPSPEDDLSEYMNIPSFGSDNPLNFKYLPSSESGSSLDSFSSLLQGKDLGQFWYSSPDYSTTVNGGSGGKRRVRIALKSPPQAGGEGGEWEVQIC